MANYKVYKTGSTTPFFKAKQYVGMEPSDAICISEEIFNKLSSKYGNNTLIVFYIDMAIYNIKEIRAITVGQLHALLEDGKAKVYNPRPDNIFTKTLITLNRRSCKLMQQ